MVRNKLALMDDARGTAVAVAARVAALVVARGLRLVLLPDDGDLECALRRGERGRGDGERERPRLSLDELRAEGRDGVLRRGGDGLRYLHLHLLLRVLLLDFGELLLLFVFELLGALRAFACRLDFLVVAGRHLGRFRLLLRLVVLREGGGKGGDTREGGGSRGGVVGPVGLSLAYAVAQAGESFHDAVEGRGPFASRAAEVRLRLLVELLEDGCILLGRDETHVEEFLCEGALVGEDVLVRLLQVGLAEVRHLSPEIVGLLQLAFLLGGLDLGGDFGRFLLPAVLLLQCHSLA